MAQELTYLALVFALFVLPKALQRYRLPGAVTSLAMGLVAGLGLGLFQGDPVVALLSTFGIVSLFLFAGLDVDVEGMRQGARVLAEHLALRVGILAAAAALLHGAFGLEVRPAIVAALALFTPSTGFILDSLHAFGLDEHERFWVKAKAIATEIVALLVLFVVLQSASVTRLALSTLALAALIAIVPLLFRLFARVVAPFAPKSEFAFLLMTAIFAAFVTRKLGAYYLVGAFVVGMIAQRFRTERPDFSSEKMLHALEVFASFFVPFYFFGAGLHVHAEDLGWRAWLTGLALLAIGVPVNVFSVSLHRRLRLREAADRSVRVGLSLSPTLVFALVLASILRDEYQVSPSLFGGLVLYAVGSTLLPSWLLRTPPPDYETPKALPLESPPGGASGGDAAAGDAGSAQPPGDRAC